ncbi:unnamed protein product, partial [Ectocarpus sp. 13 AM-2016]
SVGEAARTGILACSARLQIALPGPPLSVHQLLVRCGRRVRGQPRVVPFVLQWVCSEYRVDTMGDAHSSNLGPCPEALIYPYPLVLAPSTSEPVGAIEASKIHTHTHYTRFVRLTYTSSVVQLARSIDANRIKQDASTHPRPRKPNERVPFCGACLIAPMFARAVVTRARITSIDTCR